jgi:hypothetical protein
MTDKKSIGVYRVPGDPNPWEQGRPWLDGWDTVGPVTPASPPVLQRWTECDLGIGRPRPGYYQTVADGLGALLRECGRMHEAGNTSRCVVGVDFATGPDRTVTTIFDAETGKPADKPWHGPWEWQPVPGSGDTRCLRLRANGMASCPNAIEIVSGQCALDGRLKVLAWDRDVNNWLHQASLTEALAHIRSLSADPVPDPPAEVWEMCGEKVPSGWYRVGGLWTYGDDDTAPGFILRRGRSASDAWCAKYGLPPLPDEAFVAAPLRWVRGHLYLGGRLAASILKHPDNRHTIWLRPGESAEYRSTTEALLEIRDAFPDAPPCPPEIIREVMAGRGEERWQEPLRWDRGWLIDGEGVAMAGPIGGSVWSRWMPGQHHGFHYEGPDARDRCIADLRWIGYNVPDMPEVS